MKDFKDSFAQKYWEFAVRTHTRMKEWLVQFPYNQKMIDMANERIEELEEKYPQLKDNK